MAKDKKDAGVFRTSIGGQALMEGILMRGPTKQAIVVRKPDGEMEEKVEEIHAVREKYPILGWPFIRGTVNFIETMVHGVKALMYSASFLPDDEQGEPDKLDLWIQKHFSEEKAEKLIIGTSVFLGILLSVGLFMLLPTVLAGLFSGVIGNGFLRNLVEGVLRIAIFLLYMWLVSRVGDIKRMWQYHGAEHKTIHCYEHGLPLTVENAGAQTRLHPRCGTSFMFIVMIISILVFAIVKWSNVWIRMILRIVLLPVVVGISYEIIKYAGRHDNIITKILSAPGKALQLLTTAEPDDSMLECAIRSLELVIPEQKGSDTW